MQLHPREKFIITRQLQNPYITDTFYVRAVIRNSRTGSTIDTLNLTDQTGQRFTKDWIVPADPSGLGFYISIVTSVYTDSGYTTKSQNYGDEENTYLVQDRYIFNPNYPVGADIDYKRIKKIINESVDSAVEKILDRPAPEQKVITVTKEVVKEVKIPDTKIIQSFKDVDLSGVMSGIKEVSNKVTNGFAGINIPFVLDAITKLSEATSAQKAELIDVIKTTSYLGKLEKMKAVFDEMAEELSELTEEDDKEDKDEEEQVVKEDVRVTKLMKSK